MIVSRGREEGIELLAASRDASADRQMDFDRPNTLDFSGIETLFLLSAGSAEDDCVMRRHGAVLAAARKQGVSHVIYTSLSCSSDHLAFALAHRWTERELQASGMNWTILRNGLYAEMIGELAAPHGGVITTPFGRGRIPAVPRADLAEAAVRVLSNPAAHNGRCYELSGTSSFSVDDLATKISAEYKPSSFEDERERLASQPLLPFQPPMLMSIFSAATAGFLETKTTDLTELVPIPSDALKIACTSARQSAQ